MTEWKRSDSGEVLGFEDFVSVAQAAQILRVSQITLRRWIDDGRVPAYRLGPKHIRLRRTDLQALVEPARGTGVANPMQALRLQPMAPRRAATDEVAQARALQARQLAKRGGKPFPEAWRDINEMREERSRDLE